MRDVAAFTLIEDLLLYKNVNGGTFTQRSPIMPDVWIRYGVEGPGRQDLLLVAHKDSSGPVLSQTLDARFSGDDPRQMRMAARTMVQIAPLQATVAAKLTFRELIRLALPLSPWWHRYLMQDSEPSAWLASKQARARLRAALIARLAADCQASEPSKGSGQRSRKRSRTDPRILGDLVWLARVVGGIALLHHRMKQGLQDAKPKVLKAWRRSLERPEKVIDAFLMLVGDMEPSGEAEPLWSVHRNRELEVAIRESTASVKVDAARHVFDVTGRGIVWAVIDTGIDARHVAFRRRSADGRIWSTDPFEPVPPKHAMTKGQHPPTELTRIKKTYDFTLLRALIAAPLDGLDDHVASLPGWQRDHVRRLLARKEARAQLAEAQRRSAGQFIKTTAKNRGELDKIKIVPAERTIDWQAWEPLLLVPQSSHDVYRSPVLQHGTHVAGILGADWRPEDLPDDAVTDDVATPRRLVQRMGMCPDIELYDIRVIRDDEKADEFALVAALQYVRALNSRHEHLTIHGVNLSLSILHDVSNYACGHTPVCEEAERLIASGVVVVAAAGNYGRARYMTPHGDFDEGYRTVSITDPGNAESVITVGATHRAEPHTYGVSYFSSRGPTADGRAKPDLVAPGEKVSSTVMHGDKGSEESMDGTSMAAPHVSGAAALLLCRYPELIGRPAEVKRILCKSATDLGRDHYFQGAGLLDTLRAIESF